MKITGLNGRFLAFKLVKKLLTLVPLFYRIHLEINSFIFLLVRCAGVLARVSLLQSVKI